MEDAKRKRVRLLKTEEPAASASPGVDTTLQTGVPESFPACDVQEVLARKSGTYFSRNILVKKKGKTYAETTWMSRSEIIECANGRQLLDAYKPWDLPAEPELNPLFNEQERVLDVGSNGSLVKWRGLPIGWATWTKTPEKELVREYQDGMADGSGRDIDSAGANILLSDEQREVVTVLAEKIQEGGKYGLFGVIGSIMRAELIKAMLPEIGHGKPCLILCDDAMVPIIANEIRFIGSHDLVMLECADDPEDIACVRKNWWAYENGKLKFDIAIMGTVASRALDDRILKTEWRMFVIDATGALGKRLEQHLKCDFMDGDDVSQLSGVADVQWFEHIEEFFHCPNINSETSVTLLKRSCARGSGDYFIDSLDDPLEGIHDERIVFVPMSVNQREGYDNVFQAWQSASFDDDERDKLYQEFIGELERVCGNPVLASQDLSSMSKEVLASVWTSSGKFFVLRMMIREAKRKSEKMLVLCDNESVIRLLGLALEDVGVDSCVVDDLANFNEASNHDVVVCLFCCNQSINWIATGFDVVVSFSSVINPIVYLELADGDKDQCNRKVEIVRLITIDSHEMYQAGASLNESEDNVRVIEYSKAFYRVPLLLASKHIKTASVDLKPAPVSKDKVMLVVRDDTEELKPYLADFEEEFSPECVQQMLFAVSSFCWGQWKQMTDSLPVSLSEGSMKEIAYIFLEQMSSLVEETPYVIQLLISEHKDILPPEVQENVVIFVDRELESHDTEDIYWRLTRTEQLLLISLFVSMAENPTSDIIMYPIPGVPPRPGWSVEDDKELVYGTFCSGYGRFNMHFCDDNYGLLCDRQRQICDIYRKHVNEIFGENSEYHAKLKTLIKTQPEPETESKPRIRISEPHPKKVVDMPKRREPVAPARKSPSVRSTDDDKSSSSEEDDWVPGGRVKKPVVKKRPSRPKKPKHGSDSDDEAYAPSKETVVRKKTDIRVRQREKPSDDEEVQSKTESVAQTVPPTSKKKPASQTSKKPREPVLASSASESSSDYEPKPEKPPATTRHTKSDAPEPGRVRLSAPRRDHEDLSSDEEPVKFNHRMRPPASEPREPPRTGKVSYKKAKVSEVFPKNQQTFVVKDDQARVIAEDEGVTRVNVSNKRPQGQPDTRQKQTKPSSDESRNEHETETPKKAEKTVSIDMSKDLHDTESSGEEESPELVPFFDGKEKNDKTELPSISNHEWTKAEQKLVFRLIESYGRLETTDIRELALLEDKTDEEIDELRERVLAFVDSGGRDFKDEFLFRPNYESIHSSISLFDRMRATDLTQLYDEDRTIIETLLNRGFENGIFSPVLKFLFHDKINPSELKSIAEKVLNAAVPDNATTEFNTIGDRKVSYPVEVASGIRISKLGTVSPDFYSDEDYIYPVGYSATTEYMGRKVVCAIARGTIKGPVFHVSQVSGARLSCSGRTPDEAWLKFFTRMMKLDDGAFEQWRVPGHELFGLTSPITKRLIQSLPFANECEKYRPRVFREPLSHLADIGVFVKSGKSRRKKELKPNEKLVFNFEAIFERFTKTYGRDAPRSVSYNLAPLMAYSDASTVSAFREELKAADRRNNAPAPNSC